MNNQQHMNDLKNTFIRAEGTGAHTLILLHGSGKDEDELLPLAKSFGSLNILSIEGEVLPNGRSQFFKRITESVFDEEDVRQRTEQLHEFITSFVEKENLKSSKLIVIGYSDGANLASAMLMMYPEFLEGAILFRPMEPLDNQEFKTSRHGKVFFSYGKKDHVLSEPETLTFAELLKLAGFQVALSAIDAGHELTKEDTAAAHAWFRNSFQII